MSANSGVPNPQPVGPTIVTPQQVTDPTILDSVAGFINDVVPTTNTTFIDTKDQIQWARFEKIDCEEMQLLSADSEKAVPSALILVLGYTTGIQMWAIPANGEATEILSWRHGSVRVLRILPSPQVVEKSKEDAFAEKRPLIAVCDSSSSTPQFSAVNLVSLTTGEQVKVVKFKNPIIDILANQRAVAVTFQEKVAVFDAFNFDNRLIVTTCYLSPGLNPNPLALGSRWMAYADKKLNTSKRSSGGSEGEGVQSYTATVLHAAKSLGRGLRELGESVASSLTGNPSLKPGTSPNSPQAGGITDVPHKGVVTILDIENTASSNEKTASESIIAHFPAHTEAIVHLQFDPSGLLLFTADKRGHDFHVFRIHPHPAGPALAAVHHLYILHRGDTSARVQDMCFSPDSRWVAISTLRGTTHVFPITPYGGNIGYRTHVGPHVVNKTSRFHRSAGLTADGRSNSPVSMLEAPTNTHYPFHNPRFPPYPHPTVINPFAQIRQPLYVQNLMGGTPQRQQTGRQRVTSNSEDNVSLRVVACFAPPRAWLPTTPRDTSLVVQTKPPPVESLFIMSCHGNLIQYDLDPRPIPSVPKEKISHDTPIELTVTAKAQWFLIRQSGTDDLPLPMLPENIGFITPGTERKKDDKSDNVEDNWLSQVEIVTHSGPHRRLWMGPQFTFKTYTTISGSVVESKPIDLNHTPPVNMPIARANAITIESTSANSCEQALLDNYRRTYEEGGAGELQLKEDLADAMLESPGIRDTGGRCVIVQMKPAVAKVVNPLGTVVNIVHSDEDTDLETYEESVIHENCDEALFRPVVAPKPALHHGKTKRYGDNIITKSLEATTEVAVRILNKSAEKIKSRSRETSPKKIRDKKMSEEIKKSEDKKVNSDKEKIIAINKKPVPENDVSPKLPKQKKNIGSKLKPEPYIDVSEDLSSEVDSVTKILKTKKTPECKPRLPISEPFIDISDDLKSTTNLKSLRDVTDIPELAPLEKIDISLNQDNKNLILDIPPLENEDFFSLETVSKTDMFEDARDYSESCTDITKDKQASRINRKKFLPDCSEDDNYFPKKTRKPKAKLGVKIVNSVNENLKSEKTIEDCSAEITLPNPPKKSWSSIAASKPVPTEKSCMDSEEREKPRQWDLPAIEFVEEFTVKLPKKPASCITSNLIDINTPQDLLKADLDKEIEVGDDLPLLKVDKSSDDEKAESSSSQTEVTESDDSGKVPNISSAFEDLPEFKTTTAVSKTSKRRKKKK